MEIPSVSVDDLQAFHAKHLPGSSNPSSSVQPPETEDDGLGYYQDGVKRTLTDEQIAIFRHSEIQELIRQHQARLLDSSENDDTSSIVLEDAAPTKGSEPAVAPAIKPLVEDVQRNRDQHRPPNKKRKRGKRANQEPRRNPDHFKDEEDGRTFRRVCREMDEQKSTEVELDY